MNWIVVVNSRKKYSVWPEAYVLPVGWGAIGMVGSKEECLNHIAGIWPKPTN
ncbi:MbtH family NRPS accessory protein [Xenorhabdus bovienii]|uniref:MbtH family NRPS accessory protein n=1 Tax=Xenorhabdus bovienii TaxID=40576 RepID=UPI003DA26FFF